MLDLLEGEGKNADKSIYGELAEQRMEHGQESVGNGVEELVLQSLEDDGDADHGEDATIVTKIITTMTQYDNEPS